MNTVEFSKNNMSIRQELEAHKLQLNEMDPVYNAYVAPFPMNRKSDIAKFIDSEYKKIGGKVDRHNYGVVLLEFKQINRALEYLHTNGEYAAFYAVPYVIKRGIIINYRENHKERKLESITFAAPVEINYVRGNMGVVVQRIQGTSRYKTHRIVMPDGSDFIFDIKKEDTEPSPGGSPT